MKVEAIEYGDRKVYSVGAFNRGVSSWLKRLPTVWVEGEVTVETDFLIRCDDPGSAFDRARDLLIEILSEEDFLAFVGRSA